MINYGVIESQDSSGGKKIFFDIPYGLDKEVALNAMERVRERVVDMLAIDSYRYAKKKRLHKINPSKLVLLRAKSRRLHNVD